LLAFWFLNLFLNFSLNLRAPRSSPAFGEGRDAFDVAFWPNSSRLKFQPPTNNPHLSTIALCVSPCQVSVGRFSDVRLLHPEWFCGRGFEFNRAGSIAAIPEMEREQGEQKALAAEASLSAKAANRDTNGFRNSRNKLKTHGHTTF
jgi:hypothetical protein